MMSQHFKKGRRASDVCLCLGGRVHAPVHMHVGDCVSLWLAVVFYLILTYLRGFTNQAKAEIKSELFEMSKNNP